MGDVKFIVVFDSKKGTAAIKKFDDHLDRLNKTATKTSSRIQGLWKQTAMGLGVTQVVSSGIRVMRQQFMDTIDVGREFEREWANVTTMLTISKEETGKLRQELRYLSPTLGDTADLAKGMYQVLSASVEPAKAIELLATAARSATAGVTDTRTAVDALTTVINAYGLEAEAASHVSNLMFGVVKKGKLTYEELAQSIGTVVPAASMLGIEFREIGAATATLTRQGIQASKATMYLRQVLMAVLKATPALKQQAKDLGFEFSAQALRAKGLGAFLADLKKGTAGNAELMKLFIPDVRALSGAMALCGSAAQGFADDLEFLKDVSGLTTEAFDKQKDSLTFWIDVAETSMDKFKESFYTGFADPVKAGIKSSEDLDKEVKRLMGTSETMGGIIGGPTVAGVEKFSQTVRSTNVNVGMLKMLFDGMVLSLKNKQLPTLGHVTQAWADHQNQLIETEAQLARMKEPFSGFVGIIGQQAAALREKVHWIMEDSKTTDEAITRLQEYRDALVLTTDKTLAAAEAQRAENYMNAQAIVLYKALKEEILAEAAAREERAAIIKEAEALKIIPDVSELLPDIDFTDIGEAFETGVSGFGDFFLYEWDKSMEGAEAASNNWLNNQIGAFEAGSTAMAETQLSAMDKIGIGLSSLSGAGKEFALASAVWNTYQGASKTIAELGFPWAIPFVALALAAGFKQVKGIKKQAVPSAAEGALLPRDMLVQAHKGELLAPQPMLRETFRETLRETIASIRIIIPIQVGDRYEEIVKNVNLGGEAGDIKLPVTVFK